MFSFAHPNVLYLLLLIPFIIGVHFIVRHARNRRLKKFGKSLNTESLMPEVSAYKHGVKLTIEMLALAFIIIALARPRAGAKEEVTNVQGIEAVIAIDVSNSMLASYNDDPRGISRLDRAKQILEKIIDKMRNDKVGLVVFAGEAYTQMPITTDFSSAKMFLNSISTEMVPTQGTAIGAAIGMSMNSFSPDETVQKAIIILTDCEDFGDNALEMAKEAHKNGIQIDVVGLGTTKGNMIPLDRTNQSFFVDEKGVPVVTRLNEDLARSLADECGGLYLSGESSSVVSDLNNHLKKLATSDFEKVVFSQSAEQFPIFAFLAIVFLLIDLFILDKKNSWLDKINFFTKEKKGASK